MIQPQQAVVYQQSYITSQLQYIMPAITIIMALVMLGGMTRDLFTGKHVRSPFI